MAGYAKKIFTASGTWVAPAGVTQIILVGYGGGGGGASGGGGPAASVTTAAGGSGGGGALKVIQYITVTPGSSYTVTIGTGGTGGTSVGAGTSGNNGSDGTSTTFSLGGTPLAIFPGAGQGKGGFVNFPAGSFACYPGGDSVVSGTNSYVQGQGASPAGYGFMAVPPSFGGFSGVYAQNFINSGNVSVPTNGGGSPEGWTGGTIGIYGGNSGTPVFYAGTAGSGGGAGPAGNGGNGGNSGAGNSAGNGGNGAGGANPAGSVTTAASTNNTGAGGGGGGAGGAGSTAGGSSGAGGGGDNGKLTIIWFEG